MDFCSVLSEHDANILKTYQIGDFEVLPDGWADLKVLEKFRTELTFKLIPEIANQIRGIIGDRTEGHIFTPSERHVNILNRKAIEKFCPKLHVPMPSHFFRHMCAQHLKRMLGASKAAAIMKTTLQSFMESYGGDTSEEVETWTREALPKLDPDNMEY